MTTVRTKISLRREGLQLPLATCIWMYTGRNGVIQSLTEAFGFSLKQIEETVRSSGTYDHQRHGVLLILK